METLEQQRRVHIIALRKLGLTLKEVAVEAKLSHETIRKIERTPVKIYKCKFCEEVLEGKLRKVCRKPECVTKYFRELDVKQNGTRSEYQKKRHKEKMKDPAYREYKNRIASEYGRKLRALRVKPAH